MITMLNFGQHGRLGNQLFQYAYLKSLSLRGKDEVYLPWLADREWHGQLCLMENFNISLPQLPKEETLRRQNSPGYVWLEKDPQEFAPGLLDISDCDVVGFFQNTQYFKEYEAQIRTDLSLKIHLQLGARDFVNNIKKITNKEIVSIHVRRGDLAEQTKGTGYFDGDAPVYQTYLTKALDHFDPDKYVFFVCTGGARTKSENYDDIIWCKENIKTKGMLLFSETGSSILDFSLISHCDHNIMSHASTFSWWAAFLNSNPDKKVIAPKYYFNDRRNRFIDGFYPENFTLIE